MNSGQSPPEGDDRELALPDLDLVARLLEPAGGVARVPFVESIAAARAFTGPGEPDVDADQELRALRAGTMMSRPNPRHA